MDWVRVEGVLPQKRVFKGRSGLQEVLCCMLRGESVLGERQDRAESKCRLLRVQYASGHYLEATGELREVQRE